MGPHRIAMPIWPAWALGALAAACAYPAVTTPPPEAGPYRALGQEPGWHLTIDEGRMKRLAVEHAVGVPEQHDEPARRQPGPARAIPRHL